MISEKMIATLNDQIQHELYSSHLYLAMSAWSEAQNLKGFSNWLRIQSNEEREHALKIFDYLNEVGATVTLKSIDPPPADYKSPIQLFEEILRHERKVTSLIHKLYGAAMEEKDYGTQIFLQWFVSEQIEEEANVNEILQKLSTIGDKSTAIYWIDKELKKRGASS